MTLPDSSHWLTPDWHPHPKVNACVTTRLGNYSPSPWQGFNLGLNCNDEESRVLTARQHLQTTLHLAQIGWLNQVHGIKIVTAPSQPVEADASISRQAAVASALLTADCLPVLFARSDGNAVASAHAGWRGLAAGILEKTAAQLAPQGEALSAWLGPCICQSCYQVGKDVYQAFNSQQQTDNAAFIKDGPDHYRFSLSAIARQQLQQSHITVTDSQLCTSCQNTRFYSHRKENGKTGRFASLVWLEE